MRAVQFDPFSFKPNPAARSWNSAAVKLSARCGQLWAINTPVLQVHSHVKNKYSCMSGAVNLKSTSRQWELMET